MSVASGRTVALAVAFVALVTVPYWMPGIYYINVSSQILFYAIFALGLNIMVGYAGLVSLGHAGLFGITAYAIAYLHQSGWGHPEAIISALLISLIATAVFAALALRATGIGFIMITLALGQIIWGLAYRWISLTNGDNGINVRTRPAPFGYDLSEPAAFYYATLVIFLVCVAAVAIFVRSPFGAALRGTRDQPRRMNALGYHVWAIRFWSCLLSGLLTAIAGALFVYYTQFISPQTTALTASAEVLLMVIAGGPATLLGPDRRRGAGGRGQERGVGLHRALEFPAWRDLCRHRHPDAGGPGARHGAAVARRPAGVPPTARHRARSKRGAETMTALTVNRLCKAFGGLRVTTNVDLNVEAGERRLIIGPNGAGKTTLFNLITGELTPDSGSIRLFDRDITAVPSRRRAHLGMARTYQIITLFARDTILRNVTLALLGLSKSRWNPIAVLDRQRDLVDRAHQALERVGLRHIAERPLAQTSYGERRRVEIAMALAQSPKVLLLDEPFAGLSIDERQDVQQLLRAIPRDVTIVMIEHNMDVALDFAERITLLHFGEVIVEGTRAEVVADPRTREVYLGH